MSARGTLLLTSFGPFPGVPDNVSTLFVRKLGNLAARRFAAHRVLARALPTEWALAPKKLSTLYLRERPKLVLHFGVSDRATGFVVEHIARNQQSPTPDAAGALPPSSRVYEGGPKTLNSTLPVDEIERRLQDLGLDVCSSDNAGSYLCNAIFYRSLLMAAACPEPVIAGFIHMPTSISAPLTAAARKAGHKASFDWEMALTGGLEIIRTCLGRPPSQKQSHQQVAVKGR